MDLPPMQNFSTRLKPYLPLLAFLVIQIVFYTWFSRIFQ